MIRFTVVWHQDALDQLVILWLDATDRAAVTIRWAVHGKDEVQCHALSIRDDQRFAVTPTQLRDAERTLDELRTQDDMNIDDIDQLRRELRDVLLQVRVSRTVEG